MRTLSLVSRVLCLWAVCGHVGLIGKMSRARQGGLGSINKLNSWFYFIIIYFLSKDLKIYILHTDYAKKVNKRLE